jgi:hypothetical protein
VHLYRAWGDALLSPFCAPTTASASNDLTQQHQSETSCTGRLTICDVPPQGPKLPPLLNDGVEEDEAEQQLLEGTRLGAGLKELLVLCNMENETGSRAPLPCCHV